MYSKTVVRLIFMMCGHPKGLDLWPDLAPGNTKELGFTTGSAVRERDVREATQFFLHGS
jgi:hypothetical protein